MLSAIREDGFEVPVSIASGGGPGIEPVCTLDPMYESLSKWGSGLKKEDQDENNHSHAS